MTARDMDVTAEVMGLPLLRTRLQACAISSFYCGIPRTASVPPPAMGPGYYGGILDPSCSAAWDAPAVPHRGPIT